MTLGLIGFTILFACLTADSLQFRKSENFSVWAIPSPVQQVGVDPLSVRSQGSLRVGKFTGVGGFPGLYWVFGVLTVVTFCLAVWSALR
ncbi:MAG: hypothetical protein EON54_03575 [Alcaligenaceae bacterium]|nr:MAG: hypothetical protein EON54_03575 [Alcaligenaceae bacterium]